MAESGASLCFLHLRNRVWNTNADPIIWTPHDFSPPHTFSSTFFIFILKLRCVSGKISHPSSFRNTSQAFAFITGTTKPNKQVPRPVVNYGGDLDTLYTHWCSFQILLLCIRKGNGNYVFSIFHFSVFPRDISCHYFMRLQIFLWLALVTQCCQLAADHLLFLHIVVYVGIWYIVRKVWPVSRISHVSPLPSLAFETLYP